MKKQHIDFNTVIDNDEEILELALFAIDNAESEEATPKAAIDIAIWYVLNEFAEEEKDNITDEEIQQRISELIVGYALKNLCDKDVVETVFDEKGEVLYKLTEKGEKVYQELESEA